MTRPVAFGLNVDPSAGGLAVAARIAAIADAATIDVLSGGRFELGLGAGGFYDAIAGVGGPRGLYPGRSGLVRPGTRPAANVAPSVTHARGKAT